MTNEVTKQVSVDDLEYLQEILVRSKTPKVSFTGVFEDMRVSAENSRLIAINDAINKINLILNK